MGETEISSVGAKVCCSQHGDVSSNRSLQSVDVKPERGVTISSPSPLPSESLPVTPPPSTSHQHSSSPKTYDCTTCSKKFSKPSKLKNHMHLHTGERPFACKHPGCDKAYTNSSHLLRHIKSHQGNVAPLQICLECKAMFRSAGGLRKHMKTIHVNENEYPYACNECGRAFRKKKLLAYHMHEHGGNPAFRCQHCDVQFTHKYLYNRHMRGHRTHPCRLPGCKVVLANWSLFRKHMALHNREDCSVETVIPEKLGTEEIGVETTDDNQKYIVTEVQEPTRVPGRKCPVCSVVIRSRSRYYTHIEQHKDILKCPHPACERVYTYKRNLDNHIRTHHSEEARFVCDICSRNLASKQKLKMHKINMHVNGPKPHFRRIPSRPRKDTGVKKRALAARLAGIEIPYEEEKRLLHEDEEFRKGDPLSTSVVLSSPESGFFSIPGALRSNLSGISDFGMSSGTEEYLTGEPTDASDLQGPNETQRRNEDPDSSSDGEYMYSGGDSSDEESGSGHCEDDDDEDGDGDDDHEDDEGGDDDEDDDFNEDEDEDDDEGEESNNREEGGGEGEGDNLAQGDGNSGKRPGSESLSRDDIQDGGGDFGVDRDSTVPSEESFEDAESPGEFITGDLEETVENQTSSKRKGDELDEPASKKRRNPFELADTSGTPDVAVAEDCVLPDLKQLNRNVDPSVFEVKIAKEKASKRLPEDVWVSTFQTSIDHCLPEKGSGAIKLERDRS